MLSARIHWHDAVRRTTRVCPRSWMKELWTRGRLRNVPSLFAEKRISATPQRGKVKLRPIFGRLPCGKRRAKSLACGPHTCLRSRHAIRFRMQNISWNPVRGCGGNHCQGLCQRDGFFYGCLSRRLSFQLQIYGKLLTPANFFSCFLLGFSRAESTSKCNITEYF